MSVNKGVWKNQAVGENSLGLPLQQFSPLAEGSVNESIAWFCRSLFSQHCPLLLRADEILVTPWSFSSPQLPSTGAVFSRTALPEDSFLC